MIKKCQQRDMKAQEQLYKQYASMFRIVCRRYLKDQDQLNDVLQDGFLKIFDSIGTFKGEGSFEGWMKKIILNTALQQIRKNKKYQAMYSTQEIELLSLEIAENEQEEKMLERKEINHEKVDYSLIEKAEFTKEELFDCLKTLKHEFMMVFQLYYIKELPHQEIAQLLLIDENTSRTRLFRAKKLIQEELYRRSILKLSI